MNPTDSNQTSKSAGDDTDMKDQARQVAGQARAQARETADRQKDRTADRAGSVADALHKTGEQLRHEDQEWLAGAADRLADGAERLAGELRGQDAGSLVERAQDFARRQPATFLAGAVAAGFLLTRFMKSSERREHEERNASQHTDFARSSGPPAAPTHDGASHILSSNKEVQHASPH